MLAASLAALVVLAAPTVLAQPKKEPPKEAAKEPAKDAPKGEVRRDPENKTGISPYVEQIGKGDASFVARDVPGAIAAYQEAIKLDGTRMLGFFRLGEAQLAAGKPDDAEGTWKAGLNKKGPEELQARILFVLADLKERQQKLTPEAKEAWAAYAAYLGQNAKAGGYPATATERQKMVDRRAKDEKDYAAVKTRVAQREAEKKKEAEDNAKKDVLNR